MTSDVFTVISIVRVAALKNLVVRASGDERLRPPAESLCHVSIAAATTRGR